MDGLRQQQAAYDRERFLRDCFGATEEEIKNALWQWHRDRAERLFDELRDVVATVKPDELPRFIDEMQRRLNRVKQVIERCEALRS